MSASTAASVVEPAAGGIARVVSTGRVRSTDGTTIGYRRLGSGPGLVLVHGTMSSGYNHLQLAETLAEEHTVYLPDRRGRGLSGAHGEEHGMRQEVEDLAAILAESGARSVFGVSSGGLICLQLALTHGAIDRVALFEPPLLRDATWAVRAIRRLESEFARGDMAAALVTGMQAARMGPPILRLMPRRLLEVLTGRYLASQDRDGAGEYEPMRRLAPTLRHDFAIVAEMAGTAERFRALRPEVLLMGGSRSPSYLEDALSDLARTLPRATSVELPGLDHAATWNADVGGRPLAIAPELRRFFRNG
jgi:pimeloyl-ACP methyl ester carboxylesterase